MLIEILSGKKDRYSLGKLDPWSNLRPLAH